MNIHPNVAYPGRGKTRKSASDVAAHRLGQVEAYLTVRRVLSEASTASDGVLSRERSDFYRFGHVTLGFILRVAASPRRRVGLTLALSV